MKIKLRYILILLLKPAEITFLCLMIIQVNC